MSSWTPVWIGFALISAAFLYLCYAVDVAKQDCRARNPQHAEFCK